MPTKPKADAARDAKTDANAELTLTLASRMKDVPQADWDALLPEDSSPFLEWTWLDALEEANCVGEASGWLPQHFLLHRGKTLIAAAPAYLKMNSEGEFVFDWSWADLASRVGVAYYPKLVFAVPFTPATGERVLIAPGEDRAKILTAFAQVAREVIEKIGASSAHVLFPRDAELKGWLESGAGFLERSGVQFHWHNRGYATWDDFLATFSSKRRNQIKRERAQPEKDGIVIETLKPEAYTREMADTMHAIYGVTVDKFHWGRRYLNKKFFRLLAERFSHRLAWVVARQGAGGEIVAGAFNVQKGKVLYGRYWGGLIETPFLHFNVCYYHGIQQCIDQGLDLFEPGAGGEHKKVRGFLPAVTHSAHYIAEPRMRRAIGDFLFRERMAVEHHVADEIGEDNARLARQAEARGETTANHAAPPTTDDDLTVP